MKNSEIIFPRAEILRFFACIPFSLRAKMLRRKPQKCAAFSQIFPRRKGLTALQRGPRCGATGTPLQADGVLIADQRGPYGKTTEFFSPKNDMVMLKKGQCRRFFKRIPYVKFRDIIITYQPPSGMTGKVRVTVKFITKRWHIWQEIINFANKSAACRNLGESQQYKRNQTY